MKTLVKIVKLVDGYELWFRVEGYTGRYEKEFVARPMSKAA
jgi:hypothetical protein